MWGSRWAAAAGPDAGSHGEGDAEPARERALRAETRAVPGLDRKAQPGLALGCPGDVGTRVPNQGITQDFWPPGWRTQVVPGRLIAGLATARGPGQNVSAAEAGAVRPPLSLSCDRAGSCPPLPPPRSI